MQVPLEKAGIATIVDSSIALDRLFHHSLHALIEFSPQENPLQHAMDSLRHFTISIDQLHGIREDIAKPKKAYLTADQQGVLIGLQESLPRQMHVIRQHLEESAANAVEAHRCSAEEAQQLCEKPLHYLEQAEHSISSLYELLEAKFSAVRRIQYSPPDDLTP